MVFPTLETSTSNIQHSADQRETGFLYSNSNEVAIPTEHRKRNNCKTSNFKWIMSLLKHSPTWMLGIECWLLDFHDSPCRSGLIGLSSIARRATDGSNEDSNSHSTADGTSDKRRQVIYFYHGYLWHKFERILYPEAYLIYVTLPLVPA